jgi:phosphate transport system substrate-binding protein
MNLKYKIALAFVPLFTFYGCNSNDNPLAYQTDTHGRGKATILVEESFKRLFDTSIYTFESQFPKADVIPEYMSENKIIEAFFDNKSKTIVISRDFTKEEKAILKKQQVEVRSDKVAIDAIAIIINPANKDTLMTVDQLKAILTGKQTKWNSLGTKINVVYDQANSANFNYLKNYCGEENMNKELFAVNSNEEVINYVKKNPSAMGVIGLNWISDQDDFDVLDFLDGIKVVALAEEENGKYFQPYAGFIYTKEYPLTRDIWIINKGRKSGLNTGFVLFMISETGQTIVQKSSLVPANAPVRLIQMRTE